MLRCRSPVLPSRPGEFHPEPLTADPGGRVTPRFWHLLIRFRHFIDGLLALASLNLACRILVPAFPQRSRPSLLTTAACGGLRSTPDCRPRRARLHLSYSCAPAVWTGSTRDTRPGAEVAFGRLECRRRSHLAPSAFGTETFSSLSDLAPGAS